MGQMVKSIKIWWLKRRAKYHYIRATTLPKYVNCGLTFYHYMRPDIAASKYKFNDLMDKLKGLGEPVPETRL